MVVAALFHDIGKIRTNKSGGLMDAVEVLRLGGHDVKTEISTK